jgi:phage terminase large subunit
MTVSFENFAKSINPKFLPFIRDRKSPVKISYGGAGSSKSYSAAQEIIFYTMTEPGRNTLIVRKVDRTNSFSTFPLIRQIIGKFNAPFLWTINKTTKEITYGPNGNMIVFQGLDNPEKIKGITFPRGILTNIWFEEATQGTLDDFSQLQLRLRGESQLIKQILLSHNPVSAKNWTKTFIDSNRDKYNILHSTYLDNQFLSKEDIKRMEDLKEQNLNYYKIYALGEWGNLEGLVFKNFTVEDFDISIYEDKQHIGMDFGYKHPYAIVKTHIDQGKREIRILDEYTATEQSTSQVINEVGSWVPKGHPVVADSASPMIIKDWKEKGYQVYGAKKGKDSIKASLDFLLGYKIIIHKSCVAVIDEFNSWSWRTGKDGRQYDVPVDFGDDCIDAIRYSLEEYWTHREIDTSRDIAAELMGGLCSR